MINAHELRIGNYIYGLFSQVVVRGTTKDGVWLTNECGPVHISLVKPIPLTEEWLLKFGFIAVDQYELSLRCGYLTICWPDYACYLIYNSQQILLRDIKFLHELQNLVFALTGTELTINDKEER